MLLELIYGGAGAVIGVVAMRWRRPSSTAARCRASQYSKGEHGSLTFGIGRCEALADPRCLGFNCTMHCKHGGCDGACLK